MKKGISRPKTHVSFTNASGAKWKTKPTLSSLTLTLEQTDDWVLQVDLSLPKDDQRAKEPFPAHIGKGEFATATRPDILIYSVKIQITSPWDANMSQAHGGKMKKYADEGLHAIPGWASN